MLERKVYSELLAWKLRRKEEGIKKCLMIKEPDKSENPILYENLARKNMNRLLKLTFSAIRN